MDDFNVQDITLSEKRIRVKHRQHLAAAIEAVRGMLKLRRTHESDDGRLDLLIFPELAVHPEDIRTQLMPFARANKTLIVAGLTYDKVSANEPPINSALWIIPEVSTKVGFGMRTRRQGKLYIAPQEKSLGIRGFRPCQWIIEYPLSGRSRGLRLTASVCYDATDLALVADLRNRTDIFAIPAFNRDVKTFDQMALALHYHMFQLVVVANSGQFGGSNAYWPKHGEFSRQVFHLHGQPQASIAFLKIEDVDGFLSRGKRRRRRRKKSSRSKEVWKEPPAGWLCPEDVTGDDRS